MFSPEVESRSPAVQFEIDAARYRRQIEYLFERLPFYRKKLQQAGFANASQVDGLRDIHTVPFTDKDDIRRTQAEHGEHLACDPQNLCASFPRAARRACLATSDSRARIWICLPPTWRAATSWRESSFMWGSSTRKMANRHSLTLDLEWGDRQVELGLSLRRNFERIENPQPPQEPLQSI